jgi:CPA2 family monovalent cation:H+ antiporter-2
VAQIATATAIGVGMAIFWGWSLGAGLVFGLALSVASTVVLLRALQERGILDSLNGRIAVGWLIVEDLAMVLALVLIPTFANLQAGGATTPASFAKVSDALVAAQAELAEAEENWLELEILREEIEGG